MESADVAVLETTLNDFDPQVRAAALSHLVNLLEQGRIEPGLETEVANMHCHTFYSFNAYGHSPTSLAWLAKRNGYKLVGLVDFDVLDGVDEFLDACDVLGVRGSTGIETRVYLSQYASLEINSPGEPGVYYNMGIGFTTGHVPEETVHILVNLRQRAARRNQRVIERVNDHLYPLTIDYEQDVLPLTPAGNPTERHIVLAYLREVVRKGLDPVDFWSKKLRIPPRQVEESIKNPPHFQNLVRSRLMKRGGVGYVQPTSGSFPVVEEFHKLIRSCGALPCATWLDGTSPGEQSIEELLELLISEGSVALNIIPDRNWNVSDPADRLVKIHNLYEVVRLAEKFALPLNVGTEMNTYGQKLVDDFNNPELAPLRKVFMDGAYFIFGHTLLQRTLSLGYQSEWALAHFPDRKERNRFYLRAGRSALPGKTSIDKLKQFGPEALPDELLAVLIERENSHVR